MLDDRIIRNCIFRTHVYYTLLFAGFIYIFTLSLYTYAGKSMYPSKHKVIPREEAQARNQFLNRRDIDFGLKIRKQEALAEFNHQFRCSLAQTSVSDKRTRNTQIQKQHHVKYLQNVKLIFCHENTRDSECWKCHASEKVSVRSLTRYVNYYRTDYSSLRASHESLRFFSFKRRDVHTVHLEVSSAVKT